VAYGFVVGILCTAGMKSGRVNKSGPALVIGLVVGVFTVWAAWMSYFWLRAGYSFEDYFYLLRNPQEFFDAISFYANHPAWSIGKSKSAEPAIFYYAVWLGEAAILVGLIVYQPLKFVKENRLCQDCGKWLKPSGDKSFFVAEGMGVQELKTELQAGSVRALMSRERTVPDVSASWLEVEGYACAECQDADLFINVTMVTMVKGKKKDELERKTEVLARFVPVSAADEAALFAPLPEPGPEAQPSTPSETDEAVTDDDDAGTADETALEPETKGGPAAL
jgi:hypothetical protein